MRLDAGEQRFEVRPPADARAQRVESNDPRRRGVLLYTSGTTGQPKGVPEPPRIMARRVDIWREKFDCTSKDSLALVAPVASATGLLCMSSPPPPPPPPRCTLCQQGPFVSVESEATTT